MSLVPNHNYEPNATASETGWKPDYRTEHTSTPLLNSLDNDKPAAVPKGWPTSPKLINSPLFTVIWDGLYDVLLLACSAAFLAFASIVNHYNQASTEEHPRATKLLLNATKYGPTVFPILFAAVVGRAAHAIFRWRLEKGERIGILDTLASSTSLTSTVTSQFQLQIFSFLGVLLVALWTLSPIGGQASIRQMSIGPRISTQLTSFEYMVPNGNLKPFTSTLMSSDNLEVIKALFVSAILSSKATKLFTYDTWGNVKMPRIEYYEGISTADGDGWYETSPRNLASYSSLVGIPIAGLNLPTSINYNMNLQSSYLSLQCSKVYNNWKRRNSSTDEPHVPGPGAWIYLAPYKDRHMQDPSTLAPFNFTYVPTYDQNNTAIGCNMTSTYVETEISCSEASTCEATRVRRSRLNHLPAAWTLLDISEAYLEATFEGMLSIATGKDHAPTILDRYLANPIMEFTDATVRPNETSSEDYTVRLSQLVSTYFTLLNSKYTTTGGISNMTATFSNTNQSFVPKAVAIPQVTASQYNWTGSDGKLMIYDWDGRPAMQASAWTVEGTTSTSTEIIIAHTAWTVVLSIVSVLLIVASLVSPFMYHFVTKGPNVMMNISSLATRNNSYIPLPSNGTFMDASERVRLLRGVKVRLGDVQVGHDVGNLVIGALDGQDGDISRVRKGRLYE